MVKEIKTNSVEEWAAWLDQQPKKTIPNKDQLLALMAMSLNEDAVETDPDALALVAPRQYNLASMFYNRVNTCHTYKVSIAVAVFIGELADRPGVVTIFANYLQYKAFKLGKKTIKMEDIKELIWPDGVFSTETLTEAWDRQKYFGGMGSDNMLDYGTAQESITIKD